MRRLLRHGLRGTLLGVLLVLAGGARVQAHPQFGLSTVNRYGKLVLQSPRRGRVFYTLMVGDAPAFALRQQADRNGDGALDQLEQQALATLLRERVSSGVHLYRGEAELPLSWEPAPLQIESPQVVAKAFAYEASATVPLDASPTDELRYDDRVELAPVGDLELRIEEGPGMHVLKADSSVGKAMPPPGEPAGHALLFQWSGPPRSSLSDRSIRVQFSAVSRGAGGGPRPAVWYHLLRPWMLGALLGVAAALWVLRAYLRGVNPQAGR